jgi:hypothetical protein
LGCDKLKKWKIFDLLFSTLLKSAMLVQKAVWGGLLKTNIPFGGFHSAAGLFVSEEFENRPKRMTKRLLFMIMTNGAASQRYGWIYTTVVIYQYIS